MFAEDLIQSDLWLSGPSFLLESDHMVMQTSQVMSCAAGPTSEVLTEVLADAVPLEPAACPVADDSQEPLLSTCAAKPSVANTLRSKRNFSTVLFDTERWGSFKKALRVVAWCLRFVHNVKFAVTDESRLTGDLTYHELTEAKTSLFKDDQRRYFSEELVVLSRDEPVPASSSIASLSPYLGTDGLIRVRGRLQFSDLSFNEKHPIILPKSHLSWLLVQFQHCLMKHAGVSLVLVALRNEYWILGVRRLAKSVKKKCKACKIQDAQACERPVAPLPSMSVQPAAPFSTIGVDHTGVLYCHDLPGKKLHVLLITCAVTRAVHLELVDSLNSQDVCLALRRMVARRGLTSVVYSDNAKAFKVAPGLLDKQFGHLSPQWEFIAPRAPWWGGWWERLYASMKSAIKRSVGLLTLSRTELETVLHEIEACLNSRPLTFVGDDPAYFAPLTPAHFLIGRCPFTPATTGDLLVTRDDLVQRHQVRKWMLDKFWEVWSQEYIRSLPPGGSGWVKGDIQIGSVVMVREDNTPRLLWPMGVVTKVHPGRDGVVRTVSVRTSRGTFVRPIQRIHDLEVMDRAPQSSIDGPAEASSPQDSVSESVNVEKNSGATDSDKPKQPNVQVGSQ